jgi:hypothetical protein
VNNLGNKIDLIKICYSEHIRKQPFNVIYKKQPCSNTEETRHEKNKLRGRKFKTDI